MFGLDKEAVLYQEAVYVTSPTSCRGDVSNHQRFESPCSGGVVRNRMARDYLQPFSPYGRYYLKVTAQLGSRCLPLSRDFSSNVTYRPLWWSGVTMTQLQ
ncbi:hypothetical protein TNCV_4814741 [Trichonephila clavipes]|nr:hypothetical protein TNCV_4814741 [Trichonephila clavipes]